MKKDRIAWIGTGLMGRPMAERLLQEGYSLFAYNRTAFKAAALRKAGAQLAGSPQQALEEATCVVLMLTDARAIHQVLFKGLSSGALAGRTVIQMGTISPRESERIQAKVQAAGGDYLEAPVLGSIGPARSGDLIVMVGASVEQFDRWRDLLTCFGPDPFLVGPVGMAAALKLALNQLIASQMAAFSLSVGLVQRQGVPVEAFMRVLKQSTLYAATFEKKLPRLMQRDFAEPNFPLRLMLKDVRLFLREASHLGLDPASLRGTERLIKTALTRGFGELDYAGMHNVINPANQDHV
jgi:3-hydroxyisobutyrate dehydrogenase-like beta-hydroxyacid dehydrogenase